MLRQRCLFDFRLALHRDGHRARPHGTAARADGGPGAFEGTVNRGKFRQERACCVFSRCLAALYGFPVMVAKPRGGGSGSLLDRQPVPPFYVYEHPALDFSWMRESCADFDQLRRQAYNERLGEVAMTDLLKRAPQRTWRPSEARLFFVPVWEFTSYTIGQCNGMPNHSATTAHSAPVHRGTRQVHAQVQVQACYSHACAPRLAPPLGQAPRTSAGWR